MTLTDKIAELRKLAERASKSPWHNAEFITQCRPLVPALIEALEAAVGALHVMTEADIVDWQIPKEAGKVRHLRKDLETKAREALKEIEKALQVSE